MSNLFKSWTDIKNIEHRAPYYAMRASSDDSAEVSEIRGGYFYCTAANGELLPVLYDAEVIFDYESSLAAPVVFMEEGLCGVRKREQGVTVFAAEQMHYVFLSLPCKQVRITAAQEIVEIALFHILVKHRICCFRRNIFYKRVNYASCLRFLLWKSRFAGKKSHC